MVMVVVVVTVATVYSGGGDLCLGSGDLMSKIFLVLLILRDLRANAVDRAVSPPWAEGSESKEM